MRVSFFVPGQAWRNVSSLKLAWQRYESRLMNLHNGDDWNTMCNTSPATIGGVHYDRPTVCEHKVSHLRTWGLAATVEWQNRYLRSSGWLVLVTGLSRRADTSCTHS